MLGIVGSCLPQKSKQGMRTISIVVVGSSNTDILDETVARLVDKPRNVDLHNVIRARFSPDTFK
jgi:hypothetical protein